MTARDGRKRFLIAIGVSKCKDDSFDVLDDVPTDVGHIIDLFTSQFGYEHVRPKLAKDPSSSALRKDISTWFSAAGRTEDDIVVVYFAGHGHTTPLKKHYLVTRDFQAQNPAGTGLHSADLAGLFWDGEGPRPRNVWAILDTCFSGLATGAIGGQVADMLKELSTQAKGGFWTLAAARPAQEAYDGEFVQAFRAVLQERLDHQAFGAASQECFGVDGIIGGINDRMQDWQVAEFGAAAVSSEFPFLPNPRFNPQASGLDLETQEGLSANAELASHWIPKAQGTELGESGWFFSGRSAALAEIVAFLASSAFGASACVVTGDPGSGKSAVLSRIVTLADKRTRESLEEQGLLVGVAPETIPGPGTVDLSIHARGKTLGQVQRAIATALGVKRDDYERVMDHLKLRPTWFRIVLDALDESPDAEQIAREVLRPLAAHPNVRMVVGTRRPLVPLLGGTRPPIDLDTPAYLERTDVVDYVTTRLQKGRLPGMPSPYTDKAVAKAVAAVVADAARQSFLIARLVSARLARAEQPIDTTARQWQRHLLRQLPETLPEAYDADLARFGKDRQKVIDILRPLAYAKGQGLPWERVWEAAASGMSGRPYSRSDIEEVQRDAGSFIVEDREAGVSVYRPFHESFAEYLRGKADAADMERRITEALVSTVTPLRNGSPDWLGETRPYLRTHLAAHAAAADRLTDLASQPRFLAIANPDTLLPLLRARTSTTLARIGRLYRTAVHDMRRSSAIDGLSYLELAARRRGSDVLDARLPDDSPRSWSVPWARWRQEMPHSLVETPHDSISAIATAVVNGRPVAITGGREGRVLIWDLLTGKQSGELVPSSPAPRKRSSVRVDQILEPRPGDPPIVATFTQSGTPRPLCSLWNLQLCTQVTAGQIALPGRLRPGSLAAGPSMLSWNPRRGVQCHAIVDGQLVSTASADLGWNVEKLPRTALRDLGFFFELDGQSRALMVDAKRKLRLYDLKTGAQVGAAEEDSKVQQFRFSAVLDRDREQPRLWYASGREIRSRALNAAAAPLTALTGSNSIVGRLAIFDDLGSRMLLSVDGTNFRIWDLLDTELENNATAWQGSAPLSMLAVDHAAQAMLVVAAKEEVQVLDAARGRLLTSIRNPDAGKVDIASAIVEGSMVVVVADSDTNTTRIYDATTGRVRGKVFRFKSPLVTSAVSFIEGRAVLLSLTSGEDGVRHIEQRDLRSARTLARSQLATPGLFSSSTYDARFHHVGEDVVVVWHEDAYLHIVDAITLVPLTRRLRAMGVVTSRNIVRVRDEDVAIVSVKTEQDQRWIQAWTLSDRKPVFEPFLVDKRPVRTMTIGTLNGQVVIALGHGAGLSLWRADGRRLLDVALDAPVNGLTLAAPSRIIACTSKGLVAIDWHA